MLVSEIVRRVRLRLDERREDESDVITTLSSGGSTVDAAEDERDIDALAEELLPDAVRHVYLSADPVMIDPLMWEGSVRYDQVSDDYWKATLQIPADDFLGFVSGKADSWHVAVERPVMPGSGEYAMQQNAVVWGTAERPVIGMTQRVVDGGGQFVKFELFHVRTQGEGVELRYLGVPEVVADAVNGDSVAVCKHLETPVVYYLAALVMTVLQDGRADAMAQIAHSMMGRGDTLKQQQGEAE